MTVRERAGALLEVEKRRFAARNQRSRALADAARNMPGGVPLHWMSDWETPFALHVAEALGAHLTDVDGHDLVDFCLGDTAAMYGHGARPVAHAVARQARQGFTAMMPGADAGVAAARLADIFGLPFWQMTMTASDANRAVVRWARALTGRRRIAVFDGCYHGQVEDAFVSREGAATVTKRSLIGQVTDIAETSVALPFNDVAAVEAALAAGDVALVLTEPALTNTGLVLPEPGFLEAVQTACRDHGTLFCLDETHTVSTGFGGYTRVHGFDPDFLAIGKAVAGGVPAAVFGFTAAVEARMQAVNAAKVPGYSGIGTTLSGNLLAMAAMRACLEDVMTADAHDRMTATCNRLADGLEAAIARHALPWSVTRLGARCEVMFALGPVRDGAGARAALDPVVERAFHLHMLNEGVLVTPFHNMMLCSPETSAADVDRALAAAGSAMALLAGTKEMPAE